MLAPIVLFVYNRPLHTERTLEALMKNELADQSVLYIYADGPKENATDETLQKIKATKEIIKRKKWCNEVIIVENEINKGLATSIIVGVTVTVEKFEKVIVLEDDIVTSSDFLLFMNNALNYYQSFEQVAGISGYSYPSISPIQDKGVHFLPIGSSWGWATWKHQWKKISFDTDDLIRQIKSKNKIKEFDFGGCPFFKMLQNQQEGLINSWAIRFYASFFLANKCFVYPSSSKVQNIGFDHDATHTSSGDNFLDTITATSKSFSFKKPAYNKTTFLVKRMFEKKYSAKNSVVSPIQLLKKIIFKVKIKIFSKWLQLAKSVSRK